MANCLNVKDVAHADKSRIVMIDVENIRRDFPILGREVYGKPLIYLDNAATTHK